MRLLLLFCFLMSSSLSGIAMDDKYGKSAGGTYWVMFTDKDDVFFDPYSFFHPSAIERRLRHGVDLYDTLDFPVREDYVKQVNELADSVRMVSRWFNAARVVASPENVELIENLPFVKEVKTSGLYSFPANSSVIEDDLGELSAEELLQVEAQLSSMEGLLFHQNGFDGQGIRVAIFDGGFPGVDTHPAFSHLWKNNLIVKTWDFHRNREDVFRSIDHGSRVLSVMAGIYDSIPLGLATGAEFLLARTEMWREPFFEEEYWLAAVEWADQHGADIINSSLGYSYHRYFPEEMDGETSFISRAAAIAFSKGILVINSAGNSGIDQSWEIISTPADSPFVISVGAVTYPNMLKADYSSRGPTADGRIKPDVVAVGNVITADSDGYSSSQGTSFSSPLVAGFAACLWQMFPEWTNKDLFDALQQCGHLFPYFDFYHGYGIPQAGNFFSFPGSIKIKTFDFIKDQQNLKVVLREIFSDFNNDSPLDKYVYYHILDSKGQVEQYYVVLAQQQEVLSLPLSSLSEGQKVVVHFKGFTESYTP